MDRNRRWFLRLAGATTGGLWIGRSVAAEKKGSSEKSEPEGEEDVTPAEDLMREHGVLKRVLLIYDESIHRLESGQDLPPEPLADSAKIIRDFIENYHEKLEEDYLFPRFRKANKLVELVDVLTQQHQAGRRLTDRTLTLCTAAAFKDPAQRRELIQALRQFNRMYSPHEAREDTVLFPALHKVVSGNEFDSLGEEFEKQENKLFGEDGFEHMVEKVAGIEKRLGIYDLSRFTPRV